MRHNVRLLTSAAILSAVFTLTQSNAAGPQEWDGDFHPAKVSYLAYSGTLSEKQPPKIGKQKVSLMIEGQLARDLFASIGPDEKDACGEGTGLRIRRRGDVSCTFDKESKASPYTCYIGVDLKTGRSTAGSIC
ncbi:hypothetical protein B0920_12220 [Massilia sp. KIM]|uniref:hypothetical protein n=1 Tax=Massilia sp. KIM TaxID=1955422 RepID=UPI0009C8166A|nr:hypothetical protein [Massilia sp. KIM]OON64060.1 hypothetical protein B0920_12220 [Massilia sp. KIM]